MNRFAPLLLALLAPLLGPSASAQTAPHAHVQKPSSDVPTGGLRLSAALTASETTNLKGGLHWRVFEEQPETDGSHKLVAESQEATPGFLLPDGAYVVHAAYGLAGATKRVVVDGRFAHERMILNAGGLRLVDKLGDATIPPNRLSISIYVPERNNSEAKLVLANARGGDVISLPEGPYHIVATLLDTSGAAAGENNATNSVVTTDLRVPAGKLIEATLRHRAATITLKLVNAAGGEALANTSFSVLTPGGDVIRELIGAFPSLVLAEGEYVAIARHDGKTYQNSFKVVSTKDSDVEVVAGKGPTKPDAGEPQATP